MSVISRNSSNDGSPNQTTTAGWLLKLVSAGLLVVSVVILIFVMERSFSALWQWYKFYGYEADGIITMSAATARLFIATGVVFVLMSIACLLKSRARGVAVGVRFSTAALVVLCVSIFIYIVIGLSPLNQWQP